MTLSYATRRSLMATPPARPQDEERQRHVFQQWLMTPSQPDNQASDDEALSQASHWAFALELAPYQGQLEQLGQFSQRSLTLRLTNGPLTGLEICATAQGYTLHLLVRTHDRAGFEHVAGSCRALQSELTQRFNRPVTLEVVDATATTE
ncbi:hypothetical protein HDC30_002432 [Pseudomonas sp. JAI115]|uniref:hypothetical protein n=1 Tax=Pseudomonas sp. JAI115 TaxID=2723061 RepID=UPI0016212A40|nr:hypothetical protein [Pseudomonas sp. JAI115]MBB6155209.1 hypothetical protein [Pseudomonas sp. JAI115]